MAKGKPRAKARERGEKRYHGSPCKKCGGTLRTTSNGSCCACDLIRVKAAYAADPSSVKARNKAYWQANKEKELKRTSEWRANNPGYDAAWERAARAGPNGDRIRAASRDFNRFRYANDIQHRLRVTLRNSVNSHLNGRAKAGSATKDIGCTIAELRLFIERQFHNGMTWDNWGSVWELDHKLPLGGFDLTIREQFLAACHYTNFRPLLIDDHKAKTEADKAVVHGITGRRPGRKPKLF